MTSRKDYGVLLKDIRASEVKKVQIAVVDIDGVLRGKFVHKDKFLKITEEGLRFCDVVFGWDSQDSYYDNTGFTGWHTGYPDARVNLDLATCRALPWAEATPFFIGDLETMTGEPIALCPRQLLKRVVDRVYKAGYLTQVGAEFEWYTFKHKSEDFATQVPRDITPLTSGMFGYSLLRLGLNHTFINHVLTQLDEFDIPVESLHTSSGPGAFEAAITASDALESADRAVLFKTAIKQIAYQSGYLASFMARWNKDLPGSGAHIHQSLMNADGKPAFYDERHSTKMSAVCRSYLAGILRCLPEMVLMFAPTVNSYKRLVPGHWAPINASWGVDNRTCAVRLIPGSAKTIRLEMRVGGADMNPYLGTAACLAAGLYGIENKLKLEDNAVLGDAYKRVDLRAFPRNLYEAIELFASSDLMRSLFGREFVDHFVRTREWEWRQYEGSVSDWELSRYFEII